MYRRNRQQALLAVLVAFGLIISVASDNNSKLTRDVLSALESVLSFYERDYRSVNLDAVFGLRFAEGALLSVLKDEKAGLLTVNKDFLRQIRRLSIKASVNAKKSLPNLERENPAYFGKFKEQVSAPWTNFKSFQKLNRQLYVPVNKRNYLAFGEDTSDRCMVEVTGQLNSKPCKISDHCWQLMTAEGTDGYTLTHQALYLLIGEGHGCSNQMQERLRQSNSEGGLQGMYGRICASMYPQMMEIERKRTLLDSNLRQKDLYIEQAMVCGSMGYPEFLTKDRLQNILSWQRDDGCFGDAMKERELLARDEHIPKIPREMSELTTGNAERRMADARDIVRANTMRSLLMEKVLQDGCMSHVTGVAVGLLGVYVRWMMYSPGLTLPEKVSGNTLRDDLVEDAIRENESAVQAAVKRPNMRVVLQNQALVPLSESTAKKTSTTWLMFPVLIVAIGTVSVYRYKRVLIRLLKLPLSGRKDIHLI